MPELNIASCDWNAYITLLRQQDALWARHRDNISLSSYLRCLEDARAVLSLPSWDELSHREATILLGLGTQYGPHGLLGSLRGAGIVKATFMQDIPEYRHMRIHIRDAILAAREAETIMDFIRCAQTAVDTIVRLPRFSMATATRLLTLARPDRAVSINGASKAGLARLTGRTQYWISEPRNYGMLLRWVYAQRWYQSPVPADAGEASLWQARAALLDVLAYDNSSPLTRPKPRASRGIEREKAWQCLSVLLLSRRMRTFLRGA